MKSTKTIAVFAIVLVTLSLLLVSALRTETKNSQESEKAVVLTNATSLLPTIRTGNFIMWTNDGKNLIWGTYTSNLIPPCKDKESNRCPKYPENYFSGTFEGRDNNGNYLKGSYLKDSFSGYYLAYTINSNISSRKSFSGKYQDGKWKAKGLFGQKESFGEYKFFPFPIVIQSNNVYTSK